MTTIAHVSRAMQTLLTTTAEQVGAEQHFSRRPDLAKFSASTLVQTLVFGWLAHPDATIEQLAQTAARLGVDVSAQAIDQRFTLQTATLLRSVLLRSVEQAIATQPAALPILQRFSAVYLQDSTTIVLPDQLAFHARGNGGSSSTNTSAALKCGVQLDFLSGALSQLDLVDGRHSDRSLPLQHAPLAPGSLRLADLGFFDLGVFKQLSEAGVFWLSKLRSHTLVAQPAQRSQSLVSFVQSLGSFERWQGELLVGEQQLPARLLIERVPHHVAEERRRRLRAEARDRGQKPSAAALVLAAWTLLITNAPPELLSLKEALVIAKVRWQIELIFKLWKSEGLLDEWRSKKPMRVLCEVYAKLLAMVLQQWCLIVGCWKYAERSLVKAAKVVRDHALGLAGARGREKQVAEVLESIERVLRRTARIEPRRKKPNTYQLLLALTSDDAPCTSS